jgi:hypothetical protein
MNPCRARVPAVVLATSLLASFAFAEPTPADRLEARTLFEEGRAAMKNADYRVACPKLEQSQRLDPGIGTLYNLGRCYEEQGRLAIAWTIFLEVAEAAQRADQPERAAAARARAATLEPRLPHLRVTLDGPDPRELTLDGTPFAEGLLGTDVPIDPGGHEVNADAPGKKHWSTHVEAAEAATVTVSVPVLEDATAMIALAEPPVAPPSVPPSEIAPPVYSPSPATSRWHTNAAIVAGALGLVGVGVGTAFGISAINQWSDAKSAGCSQTACPTRSGYGSWSTAHAAGIASTASFIVGGALVATGAVLWVTKPKKRARVGVRSDGVVVIEGRFP